VTENATTFDSAAVTVAERPVGVITIAGDKYEVRCPKLRVWIAMIERQEDYDAGQALKPHIQEIYRKLAASPGDEERAKLIEQYSIIQPTYGQAPTALQLADLLLDFLCACMINRDAADALRRSYTSDEGGCDIPHLRVALDDMDSAWLDDQSDLVGVKRPEPPAPVNREARRQTARDQKAATKTGSRTAAKATAKRATAAAR
jgi:hypothetical protein